MPKKKQKEYEIKIIDENVLKNKIYVIRGQKVMLDADLAAIYGYDTKVFNRQVKNNIVKFPSDMMFQLTKQEVNLVRSQNSTSPNIDISRSKKSTTIEDASRCKNCTSIDDLLKCQNGTSRLDILDNGDDILRSQNVTSPNYDLSRSQIVTSIEEELSRFQNGTSIMQTKGTKGGRVYYPYAFTEQGIYMLMTVLKGPLATKQSIALVRLFKSMKDYIYENTDLFSLQERTNKLEINTKVIKQDLFEVKSDLKKVMDNFVDPSTYKSFLILDGKRIEADLAYISIYKKAKKTIYYIDNYINIKTLQLLSHCKENVEIIIFSDNLSKKDFVNDEMLNDFMIQNHTNKIKLIKTNNKFHDRYIILDYKYKNNSIYFCSYSSKDAGKKISSIIKIEDNKQIYYPLIDKLLSI